MNASKMSFKKMMSLMAVSVLSVTAVWAYDYPSNLKATAIHQNKVQLTWTKSSYADEYTVYRRNGTNSWKSIAGLGDVASYDDTSVTGSVIYAYKVKGYPYDAEGSSEGYSSDVFVQTPSGAPTGLTAEAPSANYIKLNWSDNSTGETGFDIERKTECGSFTKVGSVGAGVKTYTENVQSATRYTYRVKPAGIKSVSPYSNEKDQSAPLDAPPKSTVSATFYSTYVKLTWSDISNNYSNDEDAFLVKRKKSGESTFTTITTLVANTTAYNDRSILPETAYTYTIVATNVIGATSSAEKNGTTASTDGYDGASKDDAMATATSISTIDTTVRSQSGHSLSTADTSDWFKFTLTSGKKYEFYTKANDGSSGNGNTYGQLYTASSVLVASDDNSGGSYQFKVSYTPSSSGTYYLKASVPSGASKLATYALYYREVPKPTVTIKATDVYADELDLSTATFTVSRASGSDVSSSLTVYYSKSGTASSLDYNTLSGYVTIPANSYSATITVTPKNDYIAESDETVKLTLSSSSAYTVGSPSYATIYIYDDDYVEPLPEDDYPGNYEPNPYDYPYYP